MGPRSDRINSLWKLAWKAYREGDVHEYFVALAESELANFRNKLSHTDTAIADLAEAENIHLAQSRHFAVHIEKMENERLSVVASKDYLIRETTSLAQYTYRSLGLAHGAIALGVLGFIGQSEKEISTSLISVLILCSLGFFLTLLSGHVSTLLFVRPLKYLAELSAPRISESSRNEKRTLLAKSLKPMTWIPRILSYLSALCLVAALILGAYALRTP